MNLVQSSHRAARGFSIVELLVTIAISMLAALAIFGVLSTYEGKKRTTTSVNDVVQSGNFGMYYVEKLLRSAGSGFSSTYATAYGCALKGYNSAATTTGIFPSTALSPEFTQVQTDTGGKFVLAPVLIDYQGSQDGVSDALIIMEGASGNAEAPVPFTATPNAAGTQVPLQNTVPYLPNDLLLLTDASNTSTNSQAPCLLSQVSSTYLQSSAGSDPALPLPLGGTFYVASVGTTSVGGTTGYSKSAQMIDLGNPTSDSAPSFEVVGVSSNHVLVDYALLNGSKVANQVADGVFEMHALYGIDTTGTNTVTSWVSPSSGSYTLANLSAGTPALAITLERIKAIRVGFIIRTDLPENTKTGAAVTAGPITLFSDLGAGLTYSRPLNSSEQQYRYRTIEATIALRNNLMIGK